MTAQTQGQVARRPRTRSQKHAQPVDENPITQVQKKRKGGAIKLGSGTSYVNLSKGDAKYGSTTDEMMVTPSKPRGQNGSNKRSSKRKLLQEPEEEAASQSSETGGFLARLAGQNLSPVQLGRPQAAETARQPSESPKVKDAQQNRTPSPSGSTPPSRTVNLLLSMLSPVSSLFTKTGSSSKKQNLSPEFHRAKSRSVSVPSPEDLPTCDVETQPVTDAERLNSRHATPQPESRGKKGRQPSPEADSSREEEVSLKALQEREPEVRAEPSNESEEENDVAKLRGTEEKLDEEDADDMWDYDPDPYAFIKSLPPLEECVDAWRRPLLPRQKLKRKTLVLDLDETLIHTELFDESTPQCWFKMIFQGEIKYVNVGRRPHLDVFLQRCSELFEVVIFTASLKHYANAVIDRLDPDKKHVQYRLFRDSCLFVMDNYIKDLSGLGRDLAQTIIIDNSIQAFGFQVQNGVPIQSWYDDPEDRALLDLLPVLEQLAQASDVRPVIDRMYQSQLAVNQARAYTPLFQGSPQIDEESQE